MSTFNPDRFKHWLKETDAKFRKVSLMLKFEIRDRFVYFRVKEVRNGRIIYQFESSRVCLSTSATWCLRARN
jgi:hypothetical protein